MHRLQARNELGRISSVQLGPAANCSPDLLTAAETFVDTSTGAGNAVAHRSVRFGSRGPGQSFE